jgi:hypothetical protein
LGGGENFSLHLLKEIIKKFLCIGKSDDVIQKKTDKNIYAKWWIGQF